MKKSLFSLLAVIVMAGCTQSDVMEPVPNENVEIKLISSAIAAETMTRAPYEGTIAADNTLAARVLVSKRVATIQRPMPMIKWFYGQRQYGGGLCHGKILSGGQQHAAYLRPVSV